MIISDGYNGTPSGAENCCEDEERKNALVRASCRSKCHLKLASSTQSVQKVLLFTLTLSP